MLSLKSLNNLADGAKSALAKLKSLNDSINAKIDALDADTSRSQEYRSDQVKKLREESKATIDKLIGEITSANDTAKVQKEFWSDRSLLLSSLAFDPNAPNDALIRMSYAGELAAMDRPLLMLTQKNALSDGNLPLVWQCVVAARKSKLGELHDLSHVEIPQQKQALELLDSCDASEAEAYLVKGGMFGVTVDPLRKLEFGRRMQPDRPTTHNSPGRAAP